MSKLDLDVSEWLSKKSTEKEVPLEDIGINSYQVRYSNVDEKLDELKDMLAVAGTNFQPILICKAMKELPFKYDIIYGQRRFTAAEELLEEGDKNWKTIKASIIDEEVPVVIGQAISMMENEGRVPTTAQDIAETVKDLHFDYGLSRTDIKEKLGVPLRIIQEVLWKEELAPDIEKAADKFKVKPKQALDIQRKCTVEGVINVEKTIEILKTMEIFDDPLRRKMVQVLTDSPSISAKDAVKEAQSAMAATELRITFLKNEYNSLVEAAEDSDLDDKDYVHKVTIEKLETDSYLK